jgi:hypothetical protein
VARAFLWTEASRSKLTELLEAGDTYTQIGDKLGTSKSVIEWYIKQHRASFDGRMMERRRSRLRLDERRQRLQDQNGETGRQRDARYQEALQGRLTGFKPREPGQGVRLLDLPPEGCRWPLGELMERTTHLCGLYRYRDERSGELRGQYCPGHRALAYRPAHEAERQADKTLERIAVRGEATVKREPA